MPHDPSTRRAAWLAAWRAGLEERVARRGAAWGLTPGAVLAQTPTSRLVAMGVDRVLKLAPPGQGIEAGAATLRAMQARGAIRLHRADLAEGALLLARAHPGTRLLDLAREDDDAATRIATQLIAALPCAPPPAAVLVEAAGWSRALSSGAGVLPSAMLDRAAGLLRGLAASAPAPLLLHGDLHHANILRDGEGWVAVDPKGVLGEPAAEAACLLRNPANPVLLAHAPRRVAIIAEVTGLDPARLLAWGRAGAVIAACWAIEDGTDPAPFLAAEAALHGILHCAHRPEH